MKIRVIASIIIIAIALPVVLFSQYITYPIVLGFLAASAVFELLKVIGAHKCYALSVPAYLIACGMPIASWFINEDNRILYFLIVFVILFAYLLYIMGAAVFSHGKITVSKIGLIFLSTTYITASFTSLSAIRYLNNGMLCLMLVFFISWGCDASAYLFGTFIGKHKLIPDVSPKKSVEGAIGGIFGAIVLSVGFGLFADFVMGANVNYLYLGLFAAVLSVVSQIGDLIASLIKREYGVKDYSNLIPGHGGIMDRFDSVLVVAMPLLVLCLAFPPFT